jgi:hypothetical protein
MTEGHQLEALRGLLLRKRASGQLPAFIGPRAWAGRGTTGARCALCDSRIEYRDIEFEVEWQQGAEVQLLRFHDFCYRVWSGEFVL